MAGAYNKRVVAIQDTHLVHEVFDYQYFVLETYYSNAHLKR